MKSEMFTDLLLVQCGSGRSSCGIYVTPDDLLADKEIVAYEDVLVNRREET